MSSGNKSDTAELGALVEKTVVSLSRGVHVALVDLHPPGSFDPEGMHNVIWTKLGEERTPFDTRRPLEVVSYVAGDGVKAYIEPRAVGEQLPDIPLFLAPGRHVPLPLTESYDAAFARLPHHVRQAHDDR